MKRRRAARNASVVKLVTTSRWTALVTKDKNGNVTLCYFLLRVVPSLSEMGPA